MNLLNNRGEHAWQTVFHFHLHVIPRYADKTRESLSGNAIPREAIPEDQWRTANFRVGDVLIFNYLTAHTALPNPSDEFRLSLDVRAIPSWAPQPVIGAVEQVAGDDVTIRTEDDELVTVHADRTQTSHAFRGELEQLVAALPDAAAHVWYEEPAQPWPAERTGFVDLGTVPLQPGTTAYLCGPLPFMRAIRAQLLERGVPAADIHYEVFGPDLWLGQD